jgi:hypothetical protein
MSMTRASVGPARSGACEAPADQVDDLDGELGEGQAQPRTGGAELGGLRRTAFAQRRSGARLVVDRRTERTPLRERLDRAAQSQEERDGNAAVGPPYVSRLPDAGRTR